jgi:peptidase E
VTRPSSTGRRRCDGSRTILATSSSWEHDNRGQLCVSPLLLHAAALSRRPDAPRICFVPTASADSTALIAQAVTALSAAGAVPGVLTLFPWPNVDDITAYLLAHDVVWVWGGSVVNLLALWRAHGVDTAMRSAWEGGVVLSGVSAGSLCWHVGGTTDSYGPQLRPALDGLGLLPHSNSPHYDAEPQRRPLYQRLVAEGALPPGWATDDGVGLHFRGTELVEVVGERPGAGAWRVEPDGAGGVRETRLDARPLT